MRRLVYLLLFSAFSIVHATVPVFDVSSFFQTMSMLANQANEIQNQVNQYQMQIKHYDNLIKNTQSLTAFQWDNANQVINNLLESTNTIDYYKQEAGSLKGYLERFQSTDYYKKGACFNGRCSKQALQKIQQSRVQASVAEKRANDAVLKGIDKQQKSMKDESKRLRALQQQAQSADGQKQALQAAAQLASNQSHQLLQIRGLLLAQQNSQATRYAATANKEAIKDAGDERFRQGTYHKSSGIKW